MDPDGKTNYVFYDPESFSDQAKAEGARLPIDLETKNERINVSGGGYYYKPLKVPEDTVLIPITSEAEFVKAWNSMSNPTDVTLIFHGSAQTINIDWKNSEYLSTNPMGLPPLGNQGTYIGALETKTIGTLKIYSCQGGNIQEIDNVAKCFKKNNNIENLFASDGSLSFKRNSYEPKKSHKGSKTYKKTYGQAPKGLIEVE